MCKHCEEEVKKCNCCDCGNHCDCGCDCDCHYCDCHCGCCNCHDHEEVGNDTVALVVIIVFTLIIAVLGCYASTVMM